MAGQCSAVSCLQQTALTTSLMVAKVCIGGANAEIREDGETSPEVGAFRRSLDSEPAAVAHQ
jgi:hypothetical protein